MGGRSGLNKYEVRARLADIRADTEAGRLTPGNTGWYKNMTAAEYAIAREVPDDTFQARRADELRKQEELRRNTLGQRNVLGDEGATLG